MASKLTFAAMYLNFTLLLSGLYPIVSGKLKFYNLTSSQLATRLKNSAFEEVPLCVMYKSSSAKTDIEKNLCGFVKDDVYEKWTFASINAKEQVIPLWMHPGALPVLQCYTGQSAPLQYRPTRLTTKSLIEWLKIVEKSFSGRMTAVTSKSLNNYISQHYGTTIISIPGYYFQVYQEGILNQVRKKWKGSVQFGIVPPSSDDESEICMSFGVHQFPAILFFSHQEWDEHQRPVVLLQGELNTGSQQVSLELSVVDSHLLLLNKENFKHEVLNRDSPMSPIAVTFYSHNNPRSLDYMDLLKKTIIEFLNIDSSFRFGALNLAISKDIIARYVNASSVSSVPFTVIFWQERHTSDSKYVIRQAVITKGIPTVQNLFKFIVSYDVPLSLEDGTDLSKLEHKELTCGTTQPIDDKCQSYDNETASFVSNVKSFGPDLAPAGWKDVPESAVPLRNNTTVQLPFVTDNSWASKIELSEKCNNPYGFPGIGQQMPKSYRVSLVVFVKDNCGYCTKIVPVLKDMLKQTEKIGVSMYIMNCTTDPVQCRQHGITGFPTLTAFRSLSWAVAEHCFPLGQQSRYIRVDYHGAIMPSLLLDWLSSLSTPAVNQKYIDGDLPGEMDDDVYLVATLYTRSLARQYLSSSLLYKWYPYHCFTLICELLYGLVPCYAIYTRDVRDNVGGKRKDSDLIVSKVSIQRKDGVKANVFELGYDIVFTQKQGADSRLHEFHVPHRYDIPDGFKCEDDHRTCTAYVVKFVRDHRRLAVTKITTAIFHTKTGAQDTNDLFTQKLPVMLILAHGQNISRDSLFYKEVTIAAYAMYQDMVFATVNVDEFTYWASKFVPKDYSTKYAYDPTFSPSFYHYPRLCIVCWHDHQHAAFYPPVNEMERLGTRIQERLNKINSQHIIKFARDFLRNPEVVLVRTEMF